MKKILCFGDSNTFGFIPLNGQRYSKNARWSGILAQELGADFVVVEDGLNNRTAFNSNPQSKQHCAISALKETIKQNFDIVILQIGINDSQFIYNTTEKSLEEGISALVEIIKNYNPKTKIVLLSPNIIQKQILKSPFNALFNETSIEKSKYYSKVYKKISEKYNIEFLDLEKIVKTSDIDGLHYEPAEHKKIAQAIKKIILQYS